MPFASQNFANTFMHALYIASVWLHIVAAAVWIGGMAFFSLVMVPMTKQLALPAIVVQWAGVRFRWVGWICLALMLLTGTVNLALRGIGWSDLWRSPLRETLGVKLLFVAAMLVVSALHDFIVGPRAGVLLQNDPTSVEAKRLRRMASWIGRINFLFALVAAALGVIFVRGPLW